MFMMCSKSTKNIGVIAHDAEAVIIDETRLLRALFEVKSTESIKSSSQRGFLMKITPKSKSSDLCSQE